MISEIKRIKKLMQINEEFISAVDDDFVQRTFTNMMTVAENEDGEPQYLVLSVNLMPRTDKQIYDYSYGFSLHKENGEKIGKYLYKRSDVAKYLPTNLRGNIIPLVINMTKNLVTRINPPIIKRESMEILIGDSLKRYDKITDVLVNVLGYTVIDSGVKPDGTNYWTLVNKDNKELTIDESYELNDLEKRLVVINEYIDKVVTPECMNEMLTKFKNI